MPTYPTITVSLSDVAHQPLAIISRVDASLRAYGVMSGDYRAFLDTVLNADPAHLVDVCRRWVVVA